MPAFGRIPSPPDPQDFKLEYFVGVEDPLIGLLRNVTNSTTAAASTKRLFEALIPRYLALEARVPNPTPVPTSKLWTKVQPTLDQGNYGTCVGNGWAQWGNTNPTLDAYVEKDARAIYYESTVIGGSPDNPDAPGGGQQGSTVRDGAKAMQNRKKLSVYAFASSLDTALTWVLTKGPVVIGSDFMWDMENPDSNGLVHPTGGVAGGHCYLMVGYDGGDLITFLNSWGGSWGQNGYFKMHKSEFKTLIDNQGEMCTSVEL